MLNRLIRIFITSFFVITSTLINLFATANPLFAANMNDNDSEENSLGIVIEKSDLASDGQSNKSTPDLGDDQTFPFIPGFGKNSGKD